MNVKHFNYKGLHLNKEGTSVLQRNLLGLICKYYACDVTLSVYPHRASLKNMPDHGGNRTYDLWNTSLPGFQACPVWIYTQSNMTSIIFT